MQKASFFYNMPTFLKILILIGLKYLPSLLASGQADSAKVLVISLNAQVYYGTIFAHSEIVQNTSGANPRGFSMAYTWQRLDREVIDLCNCYPRKGIVASVFDFDNEILGKGITAGWMLEPNYPLSESLMLRVQGIAGLAWLSNPYDSVKNSSNKSYSTAVSAWLSLGLGFSYAINKQWQVEVMGYFQHTSNGGMRQPNKGINMPGASVGITFIPDPKPFYKGERSKEKTWKQKPFEKELTVFATAKRYLNENGSSSRLPIAGLQFQWLKQVRRINSLGLGIEGYLDNFTRARLHQEDRKSESAIRFGLFGGHAFDLGRFGFAQQVGVYLLNPAGYDPGWFHRWGLHYDINKQFRAGFNLKAHLHVADFIDFRMAYRW